MPGLLPSHDHSGMQNPSEMQGDVSAPDTHGPAMPQHGNEVAASLLPPGAHAQMYSMWWTMEEMKRYPEDWRKALVLLHSSPAMARHFVTVKPNIVHFPRDLVPATARVLMALECGVLDNKSYFRVVVVRRMPEGVVSMAETAYMARGENENANPFSADNHDNDDTYHCFDIFCLGSTPVFCFQYVSLWWDDREARQQTEDWDRVLEFMATEPDMTPPGYVCHFPRSELAAAPYGVYIRRVTGWSRKDDICYYKVLLGVRLRVSNIENIPEMLEPALQKLLTGRWELFTEGHSHVD